MLTAVEDIFPGDVVNTFVGPCEVKFVRPDCTYVCEPKVWKLADYSPDIFLFLNKESVHKDNMVDVCC
jgi:hypothetical protein